MILIVYLVVCALITHCDLMFRMIPDRFVLVGIIGAMILNCDRSLGFIGSVEGMLIGGGSIFIAGILCFLISKKPALGGGDLKLLAMIGAFWGWQVALTTFAIAPIMGSLWAGILNRTKLPYGIFLIVASFIALIIGRVYGY